MFECECGEGIGPNAICCARCRLLDGMSVSHAEVIHAFRMADGGPLTVIQLGECMGMTRNGAWRALSRVGKTGRVRCVDPPSRGVESRYLLVGT